MSSVRQMHVADAELVADIQVRGWRATYPGILPQEVLDNLDVTKAAEQWRLGIEKNPDIVRLVALEASIVRSYLVGGENRFTALVPAVPGEIWALYTDPDHQGRGYGKALLAEFWSRCPHGFCVSVATGNDRARAFYEQMGGRYVVDHGRQVGGKDVPHGLLSFLPPASPGSA